MRSDLLGVGVRSRRSIAARLTRGARAGWFIVLLAAGAHAALPERANQPLSLRAKSGMKVEVSLLGSKGVVGEASASRTLFRRGVGVAGRAHDFEYRVVPNGIEDYVHFAMRPAEERISYQLDVSGVAGLRLVEGTLELLDAGGAPRLRAQRPFIVDAQGHRSAARLTVRGCRYDSSGVAPWGRAVVPPGARTCRVEVTWGTVLGTPVAYPAQLDPAWVDASTMAYPRNEQAAVLLTNGKVLVAGGYLDPTTSTYTKLAELYDPTSKTWASTTSMNHGRAHFGMLVLGAPKAGQVLAAASDSDGLATAEVYDPVSATWLDTGAMQLPRDTVAIATLGNGKVLVAGGCTAFSDTNCTALASSSEVYDPTSNVWASSKNEMSDPRIYFTLTSLAGGSALAVGGCNVFGDNFDCSTTSGTADVYDPATDKWTATNALPVALQNHVAVLLGSGTVLAAAGTSSGATNFASELYDPTSGGWTTAGNLSFSHNLVGAVALQSGHVLIAGSWGSDLYPNGIFANAELYDPTSKAWSTAPPLLSEHGDNTLTALADGRALVAGGFRNGPGGALAESADAEVYAETTLCAGTPQLGTACSDCASTNCCSEIAACNADPNCTPLYACFKNCGTDYDCLLTCASACQAGYENFKAVATCTVMTPACQPVCTGVAPQGVVGDGSLPSYPPGSPVPTSPMSPTSPNTVTCNIGGAGGTVSGGAGGVSANGGSAGSIVSGGGGTGGASASGGSAGSIVIGGGTAGVPTAGGAGVSGESGGSSGSSGSSGEAGIYGAGAAAASTSANAGAPAQVGSSGASGMAGASPGASSPSSGGGSCNIGGPHGKRPPPVALLLLVGLALARRRTTRRRLTLGN
jgi:Kelch motif/Galactose oxidase, central domain